MTNEHTHGESRSERGMALIMVLLLLAVVSSLATGLTMNGQIEVAMASNEATYAGARAAAEAGLNRAIAAIQADTTTDLLALYNADGNLDSMFTGAAPYAIGNNYSYIIELFDDDDPALYPTPLTAVQLIAMVEDGNPANNLNDRLILRVSGLGPNGTSVRVGRVLETVPTTISTTTTTTTIMNPAILVNGDLTMGGFFKADGLRGNVHTNGNFVADGTSWRLSGDATAAGTFTTSCAAGTCAAGVQGGGRPSVNVAHVEANDYADLATHILNADGTITTVGLTLPCVSNCGWSFSNGTWSITGNSATAGTYFVNGDVTISGNPSLGGTGQNRIPLPLSVIATGSVRVSGTPTLQPHNALAYQFVTNGDLSITGNADLEQTQVEGRSLVREQLNLSGNPELRGQIIVQDFRDCSPCASLVTNNFVGGRAAITYDGSFGDLIIEEEIPNPDVTTYVNNVTGWLEGM